MTWVLKMVALKVLRWVKKKDPMMVVLTVAVWDHLKVAWKVDLKVLKMVQKMVYKRAERKVH